MVTFPWTRNPPGARPGGTFCRGCGKPVWIGAGEYWEDADGLSVCVKAPLEDAGQGRCPGFVFHEPMPAGLRGAPE
jgi:hypothetical protein